MEDHYITHGSNHSQAFIRYAFATAVAYRNLLVKFWTLCVFEPPFGNLGTTYLRCSSWAHWKARSGLPIRVN